MSKEPIKLKKYNLRIERPRVVLFGNGLCISAGKQSCDSLINELWERYHKDNVKKPKDYDELPFPLQVALASDNNMEFVCKDISKTMSDEQYYKGMNFQLFEDLLAIDADAFLTTNYSYEAEYALTAKFNNNQREKYGVFTEGVKPNKNGKRIRESSFQMHSFYRLYCQGLVKDIWHIHGEAFNYSSIIMGHYYYGKLIQHFEEELGQYNSLKNDDSEEFLMQPTSWIEMFVFGDVDIIGLGLSPAESDLWWLLEAKSHFREKFSIKNKTSYYCLNRNSISESVYALLDLYGVNVVYTEDLREKFKKHYSESIRKIEEAIYVNL